MPSQRARIEREARAARRVVAGRDEARTSWRRAGALLWWVAPMIALTSVGTTCRLGCTGTSSARRSSEKPTPRREGVAPVAVRRRSGSRSSSSSSSVSTSPPSSRRPRARAARSARACAISSASRSRVAEHVPRGLERQRDGRRRRAAEVVRRDGAHRLERRLREERAHAARVLAFPRAQLHQVRGGQDELDALPGRRRANMSPRASSGSSAGGSEATSSEPRASATRCISSTHAGASRDGSRSSGSETSARATWDGTSMRLAGSMRMPRREMSPSSSRCGSARRMSVSRCGCVREGDGRSSKVRSKCQD